MADDVEKIIEALQSTPPAVDIPATEAMAELCRLAGFEFTVTTDGPTCQLFLELINREKEARRGR